MAALRRDVPVVPVLLDGTRVPPADELPKDIRELAFRHGVKVRPDSFKSDVESMIDGLGLSAPRISLEPGPQERRIGEHTSNNASGAAELAGTGAGHVAPKSISSRAWDSIDQSVSDQDYRKFLERFPRSDESFEAERRLDQISSWSGIDQSDVGAIRIWLAQRSQKGTFPALQEHVMRRMIQLETAKIRLGVSGGAQMLLTSARSWLKWALMAAPIIVGAKILDELLYGEELTADLSFFTAMMLGALPSVFAVLLAVKGGVHRVFLLAAIAGPIGGYLVGSLSGGESLLDLYVEYSYLLLFGLVGGGMLTALAYLLAWPWRRRRST